ncbi:MAG: tyrosine/serine/threonine protein phosphatase pps1 [Pleopsidium flavum]|nr:MAG: tyrosine/serine/threonine protein phosphatase pps1 [Pleopsidium flavum]
MASVSDIVVYGDNDVSREEVKGLAKNIAAAQKVWREKCDPGVLDLPVYSTFIVSSSFCEFEQDYPELLAINSQGQMTGSVMDFFNWERREMCMMSKASEIANNVWLGPTPDSTLCPSSENENSKDNFDILIEASDLARPPDPQALKRLAEMSAWTPQHLEFPSSGSIMPPTWSQTEVDGLMDTCQWIHKLANPEVNSSDTSDEKDADGDIQMQSLPPRPRKVLIHCTDGYTESTLLALTYFMYAEGLPVHQAWLRLHCEKRRNFFAYPSDVALLTSIQPRILSESPQGPKDLALNSEPVWLSRMDGSLPSRILPYMYLGNLGHANNPDLLKDLGIKRILSVGEPVCWPKEVGQRWGAENLLYIDCVQDNGVDPLTEDFDRCLEFIGQ